MLVSQLILAAVALPAALANPFPIAGLAPRAPSTCTPYVDHKPNYRCEERGFLLLGAQSISGFESPTSNYVGCYDACVANEQCVSFAFNDLNKYCSLFDTGLSQKGFVPFPFSPVQVWNLQGCFDIAQQSGSGCPTIPGTVSHRKRVLS